MGTEVENDDILAEGAVQVCEAVKLTGLSRAFLYKVMDRGELPYLRFGRARRIPVRVLKDWMRRHLVGTLN